MISQEILEHCRKHRGIRDTAEGFRWRVLQERVELAERQVERVRRWNTELGDAEVTAVLRELCRAGCLTVVANADGREYFACTPPPSPCPS